MSPFRLPLRETPWPPGKHEARPCPICGKGWIPWAFSMLPCHGRCLLTDEACLDLLDAKETQAASAKRLGVSVAVVRASMRRAWRLVRGAA